MDKLKVIINGKELLVEPGTTVLEAANELGFNIPTLCHLDLHGTKMKANAASCRVCVVEVEGRRNLAPACSTPVFDGMVVKTNTVRVLEARKIVTELLLSDHPKDCLTCSKSGSCELQDLAHMVGLREVSLTGKEMSAYKQDHSASIIRDMDKCILCRRCETMCNEVQEVGALSGINRGFEAVVATAFELPLVDTVCTHCGQCVAVCPVGALSETDHTWNVIESIANPKKIVVVQVAPAVRVALGEEFGEEPGEIVTAKMVSALRLLGFDYVFDTDFAADLTIMEEGTEMLDRLTRFLNGDKDVPLPILTSCCPAWVNFVESQFPDLVDIPSSAKSPMQMFGAVAKNYYAEKIGVDRKDLVVVSVMPCLAKKYEADRDEFKVDGNPDVDLVITTRELANLIKQANIDLFDIEDSDFDHPLGESTGAAVIFGSTGGVIEAALRTAYEVHTKKTLEKIDFDQLRGFEGVRAAKVDFDGLELNIGIAHGLGNAKALLTEVQNGNPRNFHAIEVMACPGGCVGGGGQPYHHGDTDIIKKRQEAIYKVDKDMTIRKSHENPSVIKVYEEYFGKPMSHKAHELLHTHYAPKTKA